MPKEWAELLTPEQVAEYLQMQPNEVIALLSSGEMPGSLIAGKWRIRKVIFELVCREWSDLGGRFTKLSNDSNKAKSRLEERKEHLVFVRNKLCHVNESDLTPGDLLKAQAFCTELLESLL
jgi:hypothetical protein